jgi:hypothetical protein
LAETKFVLDNYRKFSIDTLEKDFVSFLPFLKHYAGDNCNAFCEKFIEILKKSGSGFDWVLRIKDTVEIVKKFLP